MKGAVRAVFIAIALTGLAALGSLIVDGALLAASGGPRLFGQFFMSNLRGL